MDINITVKSSVRQREGAPAELSTERTDSSDVSGVPGRLSVSGLKLLEFRARQTPQSVPGRQSVRE